MLKAKFAAAGLPLMPSVTHIVPLLVGCPVRPRRSATSCSPNMGSTFSRSISPRSRAAPSACASRPGPQHSAEMMDELVAALSRDLGPAGAAEGGLAVNVETAVPAHETGSAASVEQQLVAAVDRAELRHQPFDHIYMEDVLDRRNLRTPCSRPCPDRRFYHDLKHRDAVRKDGTSTRLRMYLYPELLARLPAEQTADVACRSPGRFARDSSSRRSSASSGVRSRSGSASRPRTLACYPIPILLRDQPGYRIGIHSDVAEEGDHRPILSAARRIAAEYRHHFPRERQGRRSASAPRKCRFCRRAAMPSRSALTKSWHSAATAIRSAMASACR